MTDIKIEIVKSGLNIPKCPNGRIGIAVPMRTTNQQKALEAIDKSVAYFEKQTGYKTVKTEKYLYKTPRKHKCTAVASFCISDDTTTFSPSTNAISIKI